MKILIVADRPNVPVTAGNRSFINTLVKLFLAQGHEVHYLFIQEYGVNSKDDVLELTKFWEDRLHIYKTSIWIKLKRSIILRYRWWFGHDYYHCDDYYPSGLDSYVNSLDAKYGFDACLVNYYYLSKLFTRTSIPRKGLITHDYFAYKNLLVGGKHIYLNTNAHQEAIAMQRSPHVFALNEEEAIYFKRLSPKSIVHNIYSFYEFHAQPLRGNHNIVFLSGDNKFNQNGIVWFLEKVFPLILKRFPDAKLIVGGKICNFLKERNLPNGIELCGFIENPYDFYMLGDIAINPIYQGTGLKIKTFEAISFDKVTIVHPHSTVGIYDRINAPLLVSEHPEQWVEYLREIWSDSVRLVRIKKKNKEYLQRMNAFIVSEYQMFLNSK